MTHSRLFLAQAQALFVSDLDPADDPAPHQIDTAIAKSLRRHQGTAGCGAVMVAEFERDPTCSLDRMCWVVSVLAS
jgi:hypothetical protein